MGRPGDLVDKMVVVAGGAIGIAVANTGGGVRAMRCAAARHFRSAGAT